MRKNLAILALLLSPIFCDTLPAADILREADARIERYRTGEVVLRLIAPSGRPLGEGTRVSLEQTRHAFLFGSNIFMLDKCRTPEENAAYEKQFVSLLNYATLPFYWWRYEPEQGKPRYSETERTAAWCQQHQITMKGHPLAWNWRDPAWLPRDPEAAMRLQLGRVEACVTRFKGVIDFWDVVNEATDYGRAEPSENSPILTEAIRRMGGPAFLQAAFRKAREANPRAALLINDYRTDTAYADRVISRLVDESSRPLYNVIGIQSHQHTDPWSPEEIWEVCERFAVFGRPLHFTETTFLSGQAGWELKKQTPHFKWMSSPEGEQRQAELVERFYTVLFSHPAVEAITWWDFSDQGAWQGAPAGLLREDMSPKPAYEALRKLIRGKWWTHAEANLDSRGEARFRGFYGDYRLRIEAGGRTLTGAFSFDKTTRGTLDVRLSESD